MSMSHTLLRPKPTPPPPSAGKSLLAESGDPIATESGQTVMTEQ